MKIMEKPIALVVAEKRPMVTLIRNPKSAGNRNKTDFFPLATRELLVARANPQ